MNFIKDLLSNMHKLTETERLKLSEFIFREEIESARNNFYDYCVFMEPKFFTQGKPHLKRICEAFQKVTEGTVKKLAVSLPPRAGKSLITSLWCSWMLGKIPDGSIMRNSYAAKLAEKFSRDIRDGFIPSPKFKQIFPDVDVSKNIASVDMWALNKFTQPAYFCAGVGGAITGFGCRSAGVLDDPLKNIEEALSENVMEAVWNWYTSTHLSRFETGCPEIHIATRWSKKDPIGRLTDPDSEFYDPEFEVIVIPALDENDKSFCEEIKTTEEYHAIRRVTDDIIWESEFQQRPVEEKGLLFPMSSLKRFSLDELKGKPDAIISCVDTADKGTDWLCSVVGEKYGDKIYVTDVVFTQDGVEITEPMVAEQCISKKVDICKVESNAGGAAFAKNVRTIISGKSPCMVVSEHQSSNKQTRILMKSGYIKENFYFRNDYTQGSEYDKYMRAMSSYVKMGRNIHDDAPDATTDLAEYLPVIKVNRPKPLEEQRDTYGIRRNREEDSMFGGEIDQTFINYGGE